MAAEARLLGGLEVLAAVVRAGSFGRAAAALALSQSGVSRAVARLEERLGVRLFDRSARTVALTDEGRRFYQQVVPLLAGLEDAVNDVGGAGDRVRGRLRVNVNAFFAHLVLATELGAFVAAHPELTLELVVSDRLGDLVSEGFDVAVRFGAPEPSSLVARRVLTTRILTCAAPAYLERRGRPRHPRELAGGGHECLQFVDPATGRPFAWEFHRRGRKPLVVAVSGRLVVNDVGLALAACLNGHGIFQPMELGIGALLRAGRLVQLFPDWAEERFPLYVYHPSRHLLPAKVRAFVDWVVAAARRQT